MPRKNKRSQAQKKRWKPLDLVDPAVPMLTGHNQDEAVSSFPSDQQIAPARLSLETQDRPTSLCSPGIKQTAPARLSLVTENRPTSLCPPGSKISDTRPPAKRVWATDDFHTASNSPLTKPFHDTNEDLLTEELQSNTVQPFWSVSATHCQSDERSHTDGPKYGYQHLQQEVQTQQNTSLYVVRSLLQPKRDLHVFATEHALPATLTAHQWELIDKTADVLSSIEELTRNVNRKTATAPDGIPAITAVFAKSANLLLPNDPYPEVSVNAS
ncbi:uncharacterized protein LOC120739111 isoform X9 [Simochromis diagramma]|uniref:uncharacterized protein LOC120739111 isoform X9 n=1 Tax=Simochromis diagramma TaxID=43689 RepID=UPI001A7E320E|nr:uncharacterized protein LOC120739111 isoform X9 [Simochromis diagramma]